MKNTLSIIFALIVWFAVLTQYCLMIANRVTSIDETTVRFFSFFTILTNSMGAVYFTLSILKTKTSALSMLDKPGALTAITVYITMVGLVYQIVLRHLWHPTGMQMVVDELLHTLIPLMVIIYWYLYEDKTLATYKQIPNWLLYPLIYLAFILIRGRFSDFYPYPFVNVGELGLSKVLMNSAALIVLFYGLSALFIWVGRGVRNKGK